MCVHIAPGSVIGVAAPGPASARLGARLSQVSLSGNLEDPTGGGDAPQTGAS